MAGELKGSAEKKLSSDILFDLTPEDDKKLRESDLLDLVNYGQLSQPVTVPGANGSEYKVEFALLWDDDYINILKKTTQYSNDPILRVKLLRRLKLHTAIQTINNNDYSDKMDPIKQRELWTVLTKLSDVQIEYLENKYLELEYDRNVMITDSIKELNETLDKTSDLKSSGLSDSSSNNLEDEHMALLKQHSKNDLKDNLEEDNKDSKSTSNEATVRIKTPKQDLNNVGNTSK